MIDRRYRAALIGLGRIADTIDDESDRRWLACAVQPHGQLYGCARGTGGRCRRSIRRTT